VPNINLHLKAIYAENELTAEATIKSHLMVRQEGSRQVSHTVLHYNLDAILAVGFRVRSHRGTQFRQWAISRLNEYLVKGFTMDDERLKNPPGKGQKDYFDELLERIRDIRSSERRFYQKVLDIYATSIDYTPNTELSQQFFAMVQNKMHWATHGHTEVIHARVDAGKSFMGLLASRPGGIVRKEDVAVAKNYLTEDELRVLGRIVNLYIEYAELQALERKPMTMRGWITKLDEFLKISGRELLDHSGKISATMALTKAELEYERYRALLDTQTRRVDEDFESAARILPKLTRSKNRRRIASHKRICAACGNSGSGTAANNEAAFRAQAFPHSLLQPVIRCVLPATHKPLQADPAFFAADRLLCSVPRSNLPGR
jgi:hypothetical protein